MIPLSTGILLLTAVILLIYLGLLHRVLDRMYLSPKGAALIIVAMVIGSYLPPIPLYGGLSFTIGGMVIPLALVIYILYRSDSTIELFRALVVALLVASTIYFTDRLLPIEPGFLGYDVDPVFLPGLLGAISALLLGRSRKAAFCGAILGVLILDLSTAGPGAILGGGGIFDVLVLSGVLSVLLTEGFGEVLERIKHQGDE